MIQILIIVFFAIAPSINAMETPEAAKILGQEAMLVNQLLMDDEIKIPIFKKLVKKRIAYKVSLDYAIPMRVQKKDFGTPLFFASTSDKWLSITKKLLKCGSNPDAISKTWRITPLFNAMEYFEASKTVKVLLKAGADPNFKSPVFGSTPLHMACLNAYRCYLRNNRSVLEGKAYFKNIKSLLRYGANPNIKDREGKTPLFELVSLPKEGMKIVAQLLLFGADISIKNNKGHDIFKYAEAEQYRPVFNTVDYLKDWQAGNIKLKKKKIR